jgi:transposase
MFFGIILSMTTTINSDLEQLRNQLVERDLKITEQDLKITEQDLKITEQDLKITEQDLKIATLDQTVVYLQEQLDWFKRQIFGKKAERITSDLNGKQLLFEGFEKLQAQEKEQTQDVPAHKRRKPKRDGQDAITLDPNLPVRTTILDVSEEEKICKETGVPLIQIGTETTHKLAHEPGSYYIKEIIRPKYVHPKNPEMGVLTAELPDSIIPKCRADDSLLAEVIVKKFVDHMPLYRVAEGMGREGVGISRKLLSQWVVRCGMALKPLYETMVRLILAGENIFIDESPVKLQEKNKCKTAYMWVIVGGNSSNPAYRVYDFRTNRCHDNVLDILQKYGGVLHSDKYAAYQMLAEKKVITWCPCWSHIRRKFFDAESGDLPFRNWVLRKIRYLFMLERVAWARSPEERLQIRQEKEIPIIDELIQRIKERLIDGKLLPKSKFREALGYFCGLIPYLKNYTKHAFARLDNNVAERAIRPLAIGRKNWLFFGSEDGGEAGAILLSLVQTCRGLGINPREYLADVFRRLMGHSTQKLDELLPDRWFLARTESQKISL